MPNVGPTAISTVMCTEVPEQVGTSDTTLESSEQHTNSSIPVLTVGSLGSFSIAEGHEDGKTDIYNAT